MAWHGQGKKLNFLKLYEETRNISASARTLGISRATANRWLTKVRAKDEFIHEAGVQEAHDLLCAQKALNDLVREHPTWSSRQYAHALSTGETALSSRTIQRRLNKLRLGRKTDRMGAVGSGATHEGEMMTPSEKDELLNPPLPIGGSYFRGHYPGNKLAFVAHKWLRRHTEFSYVVVAIDLYSQTVRTTLWDGTDLKTPIQTYLAITEFIRRRCFLKNPMVVTERGPFSTIGGIQFIPHFTNISFGDPIKGTRAIDIAANYVLTLMRKEVFPALRKFANSEDIESVKMSLEEWEWNYNVGHVNLGFPNFGLTPWQVITCVSRQNDNEHEQIHPDKST